MDPEQRREMIVRAAVPLVAERGAAVTTSQVARAARIAEGTVFRAFADKDELLGACVAEVLRPDHVVREIASIPMAQPLENRLIEAAAAVHAHLGRMGAVVGALYASGHAGRCQPEGKQDGQADRSGPSDSREAAFAATRDAVADLLEPEREELRSPPEQLASAFLGVLFAYPRVATGNDPQTLTTEQLVDLFLHGALMQAPNHTPIESRPNS
jgi:AcrR family transcriptional regulator